MGFEFATATRIVFGPARIDEAGHLASSMGRRALVVTGARAARAAPLLDRLAARGVAHSRFGVAGEPTIDDVARGLEQARAEDVDMVIAMGGGSPIDAGKAIAALLSNGGEALDYLEVVGKGLSLHARSAPFIAIPTTAGSGSEVTRNAVLGVPAERVKVSMRSALMLPHLAVIDPELTHSMPPAVTASTGLDALTHLIEAYVSSQANPLTDALCKHGIGLAASALRRAYHQGDDAAARHDMALVGLLGGMALANARLGAVHGFAGPVGGMFPAPHGCVCGRFLPHVMEINVRALESRAPASAVLPRFAEVAGLLTHDNSATPGQGVDWIQSLCQELVVPPLAAYGMSVDDIDEVVRKAEKASSMQGNPIALTRQELTALAARALG
jgi:alcohol dehydrogenase class IV